MKYKHNGVWYKIGRFSKSFAQSLRDRKYQGLEVRKLQDAGQKDSNHIFSVKILVTDQSEMGIGRVCDTLTEGQMAEGLKGFQVKTK